MAKNRPARPTPRPTPPVRNTAPAAARRTPAAQVAATPEPSAHWWVGLLAAALGFVLYINTFGHTWCLDDYSAIKENWVVKSGLNAESLKLIFSTEYRYGAWSSPGSLYRPIPLVMFALEWQLWPDNPMPGHIINVLLYALTGWLLWATWRRVLAGQPAVLVALAVLLFMAHPVHTEVVANTKSRDEILSFLFSTAAFYWLWRHLDSQKGGHLVAAVLMYALALFSKESAITLLAVFPLTLWFFRPGTSWSKIGQVTGLMLVPAVIFLLIRKQILDAQPYQETYSALDTFYVATKDRGMQLASAFMMCARYLQTLVFPHPLISDMGYPQVKPVPFGDFRAIGGFLLYAALGVLGLTLTLRRNFLGYAILFYLITFSLFSNVFMIIGTSYGERLLYLPSLGFAFALAWLLTKAFKINDMDSVWKPGGSPAIWVAAGLILALYSFKTIARNPAWYVSGDLYSADLPYAPDCAKLNYHNGIEVIKKGINEKTSTVTDTFWVKEAIKSHSRAIELYPDYHDAYGSRGLA
ncbi:MAG TPA: glycosyltransferase family 39 protein, partial [Saprospiraceae bacterium]|nr:glycosyltransferase family 39 protein [Saprospiraceae bacterium]